MARMKVQNQGFLQNTGLLFDAADEMTLSSAGQEMSWLTASAKMVEYRSREHGATDTVGWSADVEGVSERPQVFRARRKSLDRHIRSGGFPPAWEEPLPALRAERRGRGRSRR